MSITKTLLNWSARRAGGYITVQHSTGKVTNIVSIEPDPTSECIIAIKSDGTRYILVTGKTA